MTGTRNTALTVTVHVPFRVVKRGGRKVMHLPEGRADPRTADGTLVKALARAFRWKRMLDDGEFATIGDLAHREGIAVSFLARVLQLTRLAPDIVEAILDGTQDRRLTAEMLKVGLPEGWDEQRRLLKDSD